MSVLNIILFIKLIILISSKYRYLAEPSAMYPYETIQLIKQYANATFEYLAPFPTNETIEKKVIGEKCYYAFQEALAEPNDLFIKKILFDSSHSIRELGSYSDCLGSVYYSYNDEKINSESIMDNLTFILFSIQEGMATDFQSYLFGACLPKGCSNQSYIDVLSKFSDTTGIIDPNFFSEMKAYIIEEDNNNYSTTSTVFSVIISITAIGIAILDFFPQIIFTVCKCCFKKNKKTNQFKSRGSVISLGPFSVSDYEHLLTDDNRSRYDFKSLVKLMDCFNIKENFHEILSTNISSKSTTYNDSGISFIRGIKGFAIILFILGNTFSVLYMSPLKDYYSNKNFDNVLLSTLFFFKRFSGCMLLSISGFTLTFKLMSFLNKELSKIETQALTYIDGDEVIKNALANNLPESPLYEESVKRGSTRNSNGGSSDGKRSTINYVLSFSMEYDQVEMARKLTFKSLIIFIFRQVHKVLYFLFFLFFVIYSLNRFVRFMDIHKPVWEYFNQNFLLLYNAKYLVSNVFLYYPFINFFDEDSIEIQPFEYVILEITFFIIGSFVVYFSLKKNYRLDIISLAMIALGFLAKILVYFIIYNKEKKKVYTGKGIYYPSLDFTQSKYDYIRANPLYKISFLGIGIFFGLINYSIEYAGESNTEKKYLKSSLLFIRYFQYSNSTMKLIIFSVLAILMFIIGCVEYYFINEYGSSDILHKHLINIIFLFDIEIIVIAIYSALLPLKFEGENAFIKFISHDYWNLLTRPYFTILLFLNFFIMVIIYLKNETFLLDFYGMFFHGFIHMLFGVFFSIFIFGIYEVPLKKLNKFLIKEKKVKRKLSY